MRVCLRLLKQGTETWLRLSLHRGELWHHGLARGLCFADGWLKASQKPCAGGARSGLH